MSILVTGSSGHLGEALVRTLQEQGRDVRGLDIQPSAQTDAVGSISDTGLVRDCLRGVETVIHAATLHKPHIATHEKQDFVETNVRGTLKLLEQSVASGVKAFVFTSTTSAFGSALRPARESFHRREGLPCLILRTSRFFPEEDDDRRIREGYADANAKVNEFLYRRVDLQDVVDAHLLAIRAAPVIGFGRYIISATTPFRPEDLAALCERAPEVVATYFPEYPDVYRRLGWKMFPGIQRVYVNARARRDLAWRPKYDFATVLGLLAQGESHMSEIARVVGRKGYHRESFDDGPYPVRER
jgi:UDP-glucose 4-epimerase